jgi:hypothetical protein
MSDSKQNKSILDIAGNKSHKMTTETACMREKLKCHTPPDFQSILPVALHSATKHEGTNVR